MEFGRDIIGNPMFYEGGCQTEQLTTVTIGTGQGQYLPNANVNHITCLSDDDDGPITLVGNDATAGGEMLVQKELHKQY